MLVVTNELAGRTEVEAVQKVVEELGGEPAVELVTCHDEGDLETILDAGTAAPWSSSAATVRCTRCSNTCGGGARRPTARSGSSPLVPEMILLVGLASRWIRRRRRA